MSCFTINNQTTPFWGSGNNNYMSAIIGDQLTRLCTQQVKSGSKCALLASQTAAGLLAAGNLFSGTFVKPSTQGTVGVRKGLRLAGPPPGSAAEIPRDDRDGRHDQIHGRKRQPSDRRRTARPGDHLRGDRRLGRPAQRLLGHERPERHVGPPPRRRARPKARSSATDAS